MLRRVFLIACLCLSVGCTEETVPTVSNSVDVKADVAELVEIVKNDNVFSLGWSEYPSWSTFGVAHEMGIINGEQGEQSELELSYGIDLVLKETDYDTCIQYYGTKTVDATCITNMDILAPSSGRPGRAILATSTSNGADAVLSVTANTLQELKGSPVYGLDQSVSEFMFYRVLEKNNEDPAQYEFRGMDPASAAQALQTNSPTVKSIVVWNPFKQSTLLNRSDAKVVFDSTFIPGEIVDMVVVGEDVFARPKADAFCKCVCEVFYKVCEKMNNPETREQTLVALGAKFSDLNAEQMAVCCTETRFYDTPEKGKELFNSEELKTTMNSVVSFCVDKEICDVRSVIGYGEKVADRNTTNVVDVIFDPSFMSK